MPIRPDVADCPKSVTMGARALPRGRPPRVLILHHEPSVRLLLQATLDGGFEVSAVAEWASARAAVQAWHPDLVLVDSQLPGSSCGSVCEELKRVTTSTKVVLVTTDVPAVAQAVCAA